MAEIKSHHLNKHAKKPVLHVNSFESHRHTGHTNTRRCATDVAGRSESDYIPKSINQANRVMERWRTLYDVID